MGWSTKRKREILRRRPEAQAPGAGLLAMTLPRCRVSRSFRKTEFARNTDLPLTCGEPGKNNMPIMKNKPISLHYSAGHCVTVNRSLRRGRVAGFSVVSRDGNCYEIGFTTCPFSLREKACRNRKGLRFPRKSGH